MSKLKNFDEALGRELTEEELIERQKEENFIEWITYFRQNPSRFAVEYLGITELTDWQKFLLHMMFVSNDFLWIASRGLGKTYLIWLYCIIRCILYPGTKIVYTSITKEAAITYMEEKVGEFTSKFPNIEAEISKVDAKEGKLSFHNSSWVAIRPPSKNALGARANCIIIDEFRQVDPTVIETVFQQFLTAPRRPLFLSAVDEDDNFIYKDYPLEKNIEIYISSQSPTYEPSFNRYVNTIKNMLNMDGVYAICLPYYLGMRDGIITKEKILKDLKKEGADMSIFALEFECIPIGGSSKAFFTNDMFVKNRTIEKIFIPMTPNDYIKYNGDLTKNPFYIPKESGEKRILCVDTALTGGSGSANTILECMRLIPSESKGKRLVDNKLENYSEGYYEKQVVYIKNIFEDLDPDYQAKIIKRVFEMFEADFIAIDTQGVSLGVIYSMVKPTYDAELNKQYMAYDSINDPTTSEKCKVPEEERLKVMHNVHVAGASALDTQHNYNMYTRTELLSNHIKFPATMGNGETYLRENHNYVMQTVDTQAEWISVYKQCDSLIAEAVNLQRKMLGTGDNRVVLEIPKGTTIKRRDRIIALQYGLILAQELELKEFQYEKKFDYKNYSVGASSTRSRINPFGGNARRSNFGFGRRR